MRRLLIGVLAGLLLSTAPASAVTLVLPDGIERPQPYQRWADRAEVPMVQGTVTLTLDQCAGLTAVACATPGNIWLVPGLLADAAWWREDRAVLWHELGHQFDYSVLSEAHRDKFRALIRDTRPWRSPPNSPHEQFAEAYRWCALNPAARRLPRLGAFKFGYHPTGRLHRRICLLIQRAGN